MIKHTCSAKDFELAQNFANESYQNHRNHNRSIDQIKGDIILGKLGEMAYESIMKGSVSGIDLTPKKEADPGWDLVGDDGSKIQVKTLRQDVKWVTFYNWNWDILVIMRQIDNMEFCLVRTLKKDEVKKIARPSKFRGFYFET
jgi:hypothetical protein